MSISYSEVRRGRPWNAIETVGSTISKWWTVSNSFAFSNWPDSHLLTAKIFFIHKQNLKGSDDGVAFRITLFMDAVHRPKFQINGKHIVSETGSVSLFK
jgi:hypothetical protein